ncbi:Plasma membrane t-SNARE, secretory vesicle fusion [Entomortierella beljakovae]|nr:Plasma membrane t-SNARE, secretory vesicle fusion [Entomortierella beljakovae]
MSRDRLNDFNRSTEPLGYSYNNGKEQPVELAPLKGNALTEFFQETEVIQTKILQFQSNINEIDQIFSQNLNARDNDTQAKGTKLLEEKTKAANGLSSEIYQRLQALGHSNLGVKTKEEFEQRKTRTTTLSRSFKDAVSRFQGVQYQNGQRSRERLARQYRIVNPTASEDEVQNYISGEQGGVFSQQVLQQGRSQQAMSTLNAVQDRHREVQQLQESVVELAQLFSQLEHLIADQDQAFHQIEGNVTRAESDIEKGRYDVVGALSEATSARKKKWMALGIVVLIIIIILIIGAIQGWFTPSK